MKAHILVCFENYSFSPKAKKVTFFKTKLIIKFIGSTNENFFSLYSFFYSGLITLCTTLLLNSEVPA